LHVQAVTEDPRKRPESRFFQAGTGAKDPSASWRCSIRSGDRGNHRGVRAGAPRGWCPCPSRTSGRTARLARRCCRSRAARNPGSWAVPGLGAGGGPRDGRAGGRAGAGAPCGRGGAGRCVPCAAFRDRQNRSRGLPAPLVLLSFVFVAATLFALVVVVGAYLRVVARRQTPPPAWLFTVVVACTVGAVAFAFHHSLLAEQTVTQLGALYFGAGIAAGTASLALQRLWRRRANRPVG